MSLEWDVKQQDIVALHIHVKTGFMQFFDRGVNVVHGTRALLFENGAFRGELDEGHQDHKSLAAKLGRKVPSGAFDIVLIQAGDLLVDHSYEKVESSDHYPLQVGLQLRLAVGDPSSFFFHFVQQRKRVGREDLVAFMERRVESAARVAVKRFGISQLREAHGGRDLRLALEAELERETRDELRRIGLDLVHLAWFEATNERLETLQDRRVNLVYRQQEFEVEKQEREFDKGERAWREGERREDRDFDHDREGWDSDKNLEVERDRVQGWASMADVVRQRKVLGQGDLLELENELDRQALDYSKSQDLRDQERYRFEGDRQVDTRRLDTDWESLKIEIDLAGFKRSMAAAEDRADLVKAQTIGERARKLVLDKLEISQWAELTSHKALKEAEVEALQIRIEMERLGQKADLDELGTKTEQRLNTVFLQGKVAEVGLQQAVAEAARRGAVLALRHDISTEEMSLDLDAAKGDRDAADLRRALQAKVAVADFTRTQVIADAHVAAEVRAVALKADVADAKAGQDVQRGQFEVDRYAEELAEKARREAAKAGHELEKDQDLHDLEVLKGLQKVKREKEAARADLQAAQEARDHQFRLERARQAGQQAITEKELDGKHAIANKELDVSLEAKRLEAEQAKALADAEARVKTAEAKYAAKGKKYSAESERAGAALVERDRADSKRDERDDIERQRRDSEADRLERVMMAAMGAKQTATAQAAAAGQADVAARLADERRRQEEMRSDFRESADRLAGVATHRVDPGGAAAAPVRPPSSPVSVRVEVGGAKCADCGPVQGPATDCPYCGSALT